MSELTPRVSVVLPSFNASAIIGRAIDSVLEQTQPDFEILVVDDASTDGTPDLVAGRYRDESRVRVIPLAKNGGPARARNAGFRQARGTWLALLDSDDAWRPERLERLAPMLDPSADVVFDNLIGYDLALGAETGPLFPSLPADGMDAEALLAPRIPGSAFNYGYLKPLIRRSFVAERGLGYDEGLRTGEDRLFYLVLLLEGARTRTTAGAHYVYTTPLGAVSGAASAESSTVPDDRGVWTAMERVAALYRERLTPGTREAIARCVAFMKEERPKSEFYHARARGQIRSMVSIAVREPAVQKDIMVKMFRRLTR